MSRRTRRTLPPILPVFVLLFLAVPAARAGAWPVSLDSLWTRLTLLWAETGCVVDPDGACRDQAVPPGSRGSRPAAITSAGGCVIDPNGRCRDQVTPPQGGGGQPAAITAATGCIVDPNGRCREGAQAGTFDRSVLPRRP